MFVQDGLGAMVPIDISKLVLQSWNADVKIIDQPNHLYLKTIHGQGDVKFINGNFYSGNFSYGLIHGKGRLIFADHVIYEGQFKNNQIQGYGKYTWPDGSIYQGQLIGGQRNGYGTFQCQQSIYKGCWVKGMRQGQGEITFKDGSNYVGGFVNGLKQGIGKITYFSGNYYQGQWKQDLKNGKGTMHWIDSQEKYIGYWQNSCQCGIGQHLWLQPRTQTKILRNRYLGQWYNGMREGYGIFYHPSGAIYQGKWVKNMRSGLAIITDQFGQIKISKFQDDKQIWSDDQRKQYKIKSQINPYKLMLDLNDFAGPQAFIMNIHTKMTPLQYLYNLLLRNNSNLKNYYRLFYQRYQTTNQRYFCMTLAGCWNMCRQFRLLSHSISLALLNRFFYKGAKNKFVNNFNPKIHKLQIDLIQNIGTPDKCDAQLIFLINQLSKQQQLNWDSIICQDQKYESNNQNINIHDQSRVMLFRHFVDYLVRLAVLKYKGVEIHKAVQKLLKKLQTSIENLIKNQHQKNQSSDNGFSTMSSKVKKYNNNLFQLMSKDKFNLPNIIDKTVTIGQLMCLFQKGGLFANLHQKSNLLFKIQRQMDLQGMVDTQSSINKKSKRFNATMYQGQKGMRLKGLYQHQLLKSQFNQLIYLVIQKKNTAFTYDQSIIHYKSAIDKLYAVITKPYVVKQIFIKSVKTQKVRFKHLKLQQLQFKKQLKKQLQQEMDRQAQQRVYMAFQDHDIISQQQSFQDDDFFVGY